jgi:hypothetical protein
MLRATRSRRASGVSIIVALREPMAG